VNVSVEGHDRHLIDVFGERLSHVESVFVLKKKYSYLIKYFDMKYSLSGDLKEVYKEKNQF
jgi:hypothetical protein